MSLCLYEFEKMKYKMQMQKGQKDPQINPKKAHYGGAQGTQSR